jgi:F-type H+-transporting ATPase subunit b
MLKSKTTVVVLLALSISACALASGGEAAAEEQSIFSGTFADSLWTVVAFLLLLVILSKVAWKPLVGQLQARQDYIKQQIDAADTSRKNAELLLDQYKQQGIEIVNKLTAQAQLLEKEMIGKAGNEIAQMKRRAQSDIEYARISASQQMWQEAEDMLLALSGEIVGRAVTHEDNLRLLYESIEKLKREQTGDTR